MRIAPDDIQRTSMLRDTRPGDSLVKGHKARRQLGEHVVALWRTCGRATRSQPHSKAFSLQVYVPNEHNGQIHGTLSAYRL